jgi:hypothetical protein
MLRFPLQDQRRPGSLRPASALPARLGRMILLASGLALMALLATAGVAAATDPVVTVSDVPLTSSEQIPGLEAPDSSEPSLTVEVTEPWEPSLTVEVTEPSEPSLTVEPPPTPIPVLSVPTVDPIQPLQTLPAPLTELVADEPPAGALQDAGTLVGTLAQLDGAIPSTDAVSHELLDAAEDARDVLTPLSGPVVETLREPLEVTDQPTPADRSPSLPSSSRSLAIDGWGRSAADGQPAQPAAASGTLVDSTGLSRPPAAGCAWYVGEVLASLVIPRAAAAPGGSECSNSITDLNPFAAVLAALALGGAGARVLALRMPRNPTGVWLAAPVPPG